jgi:PqqD family protein of HPr-rel-A system
MWRIPPGIELCWKRWDDDLIVFNPASGRTHLLNPLAGEALRAIEESPADIESLTKRLAALVAETNGLDFDELGLIEPVDGARQ